MASENSEVGVLCAGTFFAAEIRGIVSDLPNENFAKTHNLEK